MSYDLLMLQRQRAYDDGVTPDWRMNNSSTRLMIDLIDVVGKLDDEYPGPIVPKATDRWDEPFGPAQLKWQAERRVRVESTPPEDVKLTAWCFSDNSGWEVLPAESAAMADALESVTADQIQAVLEADPEELKAINDPAVDDPLDMPTAVANVQQKATEFAAYCRQAARYGGFRVT